MKIEYTPAVELALQKANTIAHQSGASVVRPADLLRGLFDEEEGHPVVRALAAGASLEGLRRLFPPCEPNEEPSTPLPLAPTTMEILAHARELTRLHGAEQTIASDQLFVAALELDPALRSLLASIGLDFSALKETVNPTGPPLRLEASLDLTPATEIVDTARIVDASANRAREALRVLEDYVRFVRGDAFLSARIKSLRHRLAEALRQLPEGLLLQSRDTLHDVGTAITTDQEQERASPSAVAQANSKRLQEALRSLEEFGKILDPAFGAAIERLRYQTYTLERCLLGGSNRDARLARARLYVLVTGSLCRTSLVGTVREALAGGADVIQLREKALDDRTLLATARDLCAMTRSAEALFIVNDRPDIALLADADGVHLGQGDLPVHEARRLLGPSALIGVSTHNLDQVRAAVLEGASYIGVGPTFASRTKEFNDIAGMDFVRSAFRETTLPAFVLGGVTSANLHQVLQAGGTRVAASHAICAAEDPRAVAAEMRRRLEGM
jgi:thiamine-phosphate pyrophosphorylase